MLYFDFFDKDKCLSTFCKLYHISEDDAVSYAIEASSEPDSLSYFLDKTKILLDVVDIKDVYIHCKHITTSIDGLEYLKKYGLLPLSRLLEERSPLSNFLLEHGITIDIKNRTIDYLGKKMYLYKSDEECTECFFGTKCRCLTDPIHKTKTSLQYRDIACEYRDKIKCIKSKLFYDKAELEVHIFGSDEDVHNYSIVKRYPEILYTVEELINSLFDKYLCLTHEWFEKANKEHYCVEFDVNISDFENITTKSPHVYDYQYDDYLCYCKQDLDSYEKMNANFFGNIYLIKYMISILANEEPFSYYGAIIPIPKLPYKNVTFGKYTLENELIPHIIKLT